MGKGNANLSVLIVAGAILLFFWLASALFLHNHFVLRDAALIGDMFGMINSLFSAGALAAAIYTLLLQMDELKSQRREFELSRMAHEKSAEIAEWHRAMNRLKTLDDFLAYVQHCSKSAQAREPDTNLQAMLMTGFDHILEAQQRERNKLIEIILGYDPIRSVLDSCSGQNDKTSVIQAFLSHHEMWRLGRGANQTEGMWRFVESPVSQGKET